MDYEKLVSAQWRERMVWDSLGPEIRQRIGEYGYSMYQLANPTVGYIDEVKYGGHLVILDDGSRWEVAETDASEVETWGPVDDVAVIDGTMYRLEGADRVEVTEE